MVKLSDLTGLNGLKKKLEGYAGQAKDYLDEAKGQVEEGFEFLKEIEQQYAGKYAPILTSSIRKATFDRGANLAAGLLSKLGSGNVKTDKKKAGEMVIENLVNAFNSTYHPEEDNTNQPKSEYPPQGSSARFSIFGIYSDLVRNQYQWVFGKDELERKTGNGPGKDFSEKMDLVVEGIVKKCNAQFPQKFKIKKGRKK